MTWDNPRSSYTKHHYRQSCHHCWVWAKRELHWVSPEGEKFDGHYLATQCGHCNKLGKIHYRWNEELHLNIPDGSKRGFYDVHNRRGCPSQSGKSQARELEYEYDF
jgi:hypothetical protein